MSHAKQLHHRRSLHASLEMIHREGRPGNGTSARCLQGPDTVRATGQHVLAAA